MFDPRQLLEYFQQAGAQGGVPQQQQMIQPAPPQHEMQQGPQMGAAQITPANITPLNGQGSGQDQGWGEHGGWTSGLFRKLAGMGYTPQSLGDFVQQHPGQNLPQASQAAPIMPMPAQQQQPMQPRGVGQLGEPSQLPSFKAANQQAQLIRR